MKRYLSLLLPFFLLSACESTGSSSSSVPLPRPSDSARIAISGRTESATFAPNEAKIKDTLYSIEDDLHYNTQFLPSVGEVNILVIPVLIPGYADFPLAGFPEQTEEAERLAKVKDDIQTAFFGEEEDTGFHSVASYYEQSSNGLLRLGGEVTDWFDVQAEMGISSAAEITIGLTYDLAQAAVEWAFGEQGYVPANFDSDQDGFFDGIWLVYSAEDYTRDGPYTDDRNYWAYTSWGNQDKEGDPSRNLYYYNLFGWASYDFLYEGYGPQGIDAHTYIHETGHFLGLNDYYSDRLMYNPVGKIDMMDGNIGDLNSYSKLLLGWTKPYLVYGNAEIDLLPSEEENQCIVVMPDGAEPSAEFDPFSEYLLLDLYSPVGLAAKEIASPIPDRPKLVDKAGVRIYHVDYRRFKTRYDEEIGDYLTVEDDGEPLEEGEHYILPLSNSIGFNQYHTALNLEPTVYPYDEIRLIEADGENTFSSGGYQIESTYFGQGDEFAMADYPDFFLNAPLLDGGQSLSGKIAIESLTEVRI